MRPSYLYNGNSYIGNPHYKDKVVVRPSYLYNGNSCTGKTSVFILKRHHGFQLADVVNCALGRSNYSYGDSSLAQNFK